MLLLIDGLRCSSFVGYHVFHTYRQFTDQCKLLGTGGQAWWTFLWHDMEWSVVVVTNRVNRWYGCKVGERVNRKPFGLYCVIDLRLTYTFILTFATYLHLNRRTHSKNNYS